MLVAICESPAGMVFVERAQHLRRHPGQIGFPGGMEELADGGNPVTTALREFSEELGVGAERVSVIGRLPDLHQAMNQFLITPVVGILAGDTRFSIDADEIVGVFKVPLETVVAPGALVPDDQLTKLRGKPMHALMYEGRRIWGFTGRILKSFVDAWNAPDSPVRSAIEARLQ